VDAGRSAHKAVDALAVNNQDGWPPGPGPPFPQRNDPSR
jgi:hypothetical protein